MYLLLAMGLALTIVVGGLLAVYLVSGSDVDLRRDGMLETLMLA